MKKTKLIPFGLMPASWGLSGKTRERAEAEYYYTGRDLEEALVEINNDTEEAVAIAKLDLRHKYDEISESDYNKEIAAIKKEPYVTVLDMGVDAENIAQGYFELDWNDEFIKMLQGAGMTGKNDEEIVNKWFNGICRTVLLQEKADLDYGLQNKGRPDVIRTTNKTEKSGGAE